MSKDDLQGNMGSPTNKYLPQAGIEPATAFHAPLHQKGCQEML